MTTTVVTDDDDTQNVETLVPLKYLSTFWRTHEILKIILFWLVLINVCYLMILKQQHFQ